MRSAPVGKCHRNRVRYSNRKGHCHRRVREACGPSCQARRQRRRPPVRRAYFPAGQMCEMAQPQRERSAARRRHRDSRSGSFLWEEDSSTRWRASGIRLTTIDTDRTTGKSVTSRIDRLKEIVFHRHRNGSLDLEVKPINSGRQRFAEGDHLACVETDRGVPGGGVHRSWRL